MYETVRKVSKKRDAQRASARRSLLSLHSERLADMRASVNLGKEIGPIHDTHAIVGNKKYTPQELSRMKYEKDSQEMLLQQKRHEDFRRQQSVHYARLVSGLAFDGSHRDN